MRDRNERDLPPDPGQERDAQQPLGAGAEAAAGLEGLSKDGDEIHSRSTPTGDDAEPSGAPSDVERPGSEPLRGTSEQHESGYGGRGGEPRQSSDQREPLDHEGSGGAH